MEFLNRFLRDEQDYCRLIKYIEGGTLPLALSGLSGIGKAVIASALVSDKKRRLAMITDTEASALALRDDLAAFGVTAGFLPVRDYNLTHADGYSKEYEIMRIDTLSRILGGDFAVVCASIESATQYTVLPEILAGGTFTLKAGGTLDTEELSKKLSEYGYKRSDICEGAGQFSIRGGIIDVFSAGSDMPARIELWGDEIESVSLFDTTSQRRTKRIDSFRVCPACELTYSGDELSARLQKYLKTDKNLTEPQRQNVLRDIENLDNGLPVNTDLYLPFLYERCATLFDYLEDFTVAVCESGNVKNKLKSVIKTEAGDLADLLESGLLSGRTAKIRLDEAELKRKLKKVIFFESFPRTSYDIKPAAQVDFDFKRFSAWGGNLENLIDDISSIRAISGTAAVFAGGGKAAKLLADALGENGIPAQFINREEEIVPGGVFVLSGGFSGSFEITSKKLLVITHRHISSNEKRRKNFKAGKEISSLDEVSPGDLVVHAMHGIGVFDGINRITQSGITKDYIKIKYAGGDALYVPVTQLDLVSKYIGVSDESTVKLNKLGSAQWQKTRSRVRAAVKDMAKQLTALYAKRMAAKGYAFSPDTDLQNDFERRFEYEETEDQLRCSDEIKNDMERPVPMDRLLCGDVGFGKTEVALRAAFKCVSEGKQCAMLVPTTILSSQHYNTVIRRFGDMPINVEMLNRFVTPAKQRKIVAGIKSGRVDMVIGTHRLISKDIEFKNIGLVIIDEEQRFGVAQKEKLKEKYPFVDILTLSATPIPRTLNMAMSGLRDMSSIDEAPADRYPVQTYVLEQDNGVITSAIERELRRGGQVYYLHNRVESIENCAIKIKNLVPDARIGIAHGQMSEDELSAVWQRLLDHEIDILVCTTIIETGVDVPNVNTLIIENADRMGLSNLHQLRGRVGRSPRRAYAYFCFRRGKEISEIAAKRLEAIKQFTEFGSGFKIALRDLQIRGAGSILGGEQHGNMEAVGYDMYLKLLNEEVARQNGAEPPAQENECTVDIAVSAHIPEDYISSLPSRIGIYKRIADISCLSDANDVADELRDRFGEPPAPVKALIYVALLRSRAAKCGITEVKDVKGGILLVTSDIEEQTVNKLMAAFGDRFSVSFIGATGYFIKPGEGQKMISLLKDISEAL
ncbi:MAG: transcription-repair coupling factor [Clostridia bacterium]|nr:transcription-repair coupling factor [Clostridia bacterium]